MFYPIYTWHKKIVSIIIINIMNFDDANLVLV